MTEKRTTKDPGKNDPANEDIADSKPAAKVADAGEGISPDPKQFDVGERARQDAESDQVDTDLYNTSGIDAQSPKTAENEPGSRKGQNDS